MSSPLPTIEESSKADVVKPQQSSSQLFSSKTAEACLDWVVFPSLLFVQFGATLFCQTRQGVESMDWRIAFAGILFFCIVAAVYRQVLRQHPWQSMILLLLPEVFTNILLLMVMFGYVVFAFDAMLGLTGALLLVALVALVHTAMTEDLVPPEGYKPLRGSGEEEGNGEEEPIC